MENEITAIFNIEKVQADSARSISLLKGIESSVKELEQLGISVDCKVDTNENFGKQWVNS